MYNHTNENVYLLSPSPHYRCFLKIEKGDKKAWTQSDRGQWEQRFSQKPFKNYSFISQLSVFILHSQLFYKNSQSHFAVLIFNILFQYTFVCD